MPSSHQDPCGIRCYSCFPQLRSLRGEGSTMTCSAHDFSSDFFVSTLQNFTTFRWPKDLVSTLRRHGVLVFQNSNIESEYADLRDWMRKHYLSLDGDSKKFLSGADATEQLALDNKLVAHFNTHFCQNTTDRRIKSAFTFLEVHARQCLNAAILPKEKTNTAGPDWTIHEQEGLPALELLDGLSHGELVKTCDNSDKTVLSAFVYEAAPKGQVLCPDHVDRGFVTCTTNQDGGLEVLIEDTWVSIPPTNGIVCFCGYALHAMSDGKIPMVRHRVISVDAEKQRISVSFKLRPDARSSMQCGKLFKIMSEFDRLCRSVNLPTHFQAPADTLYDDVDAPPAEAEVAAAGCSSLRRAAFLELCLRNGFPWQQKAETLAWSDFCQEWAKKVAKWKDKSFHLYVTDLLRGSKSPFGPLIKAATIGWSDLVAPEYFSFPEDLVVCARDPCNGYGDEPGQLAASDRETLGGILRLFYHFIPRWGEVFEMYMMNVNAVTSLPKYVVRLMAARGD